MHPLRPLEALALLLVGAQLAACSDPAFSSSDSHWAGATPAEIGQSRQRYVNGEDDRLDYFELEDDDLRAGVEQFVVALTSNTLTPVLARNETALLQTWGELDNLCVGEPFADQPAAVFCSGVLVDWDLVLTSGHCVDVLPLSALRVVFDYYYREPGVLAVSDDSVYGVRQVLASANDSSSVSERLDFAWLRLTRPVHPPRRPAAVYTRGPAVEVGDPIINIGSGGGVPFKLDAGGSVQQSRDETLDYFVADTDTSQGSSGSGAFDVDLSLVGTLARGAPDFIDTAAGCRVTDRGVDPAEAIEEFTYVHRAVAALCERGVQSALCRVDCEQPCDTSETPPPREREDDGCALHAPASSPQSKRSLVGLLALAGSLVMRRRRR